MKISLILILLGTALSYFTNPIIGGDSREPGVLAYNNNFYAVVSGETEEGFFEIRKSEDLVNWEKIGVAFKKDKKPSWASDLRAPKLFVINKRVNLYFSAKDPNGIEQIGGGYSESGPEGPYNAFPNPVIAIVDGVSDPSCVKEETSGNNYLVFYERGPENFGIMQLNQDGSEVTGEHHLLFGIDKKWEGEAIAAPFIHYHNSYYYLFYSGNTLNSPNQAIGVARSKTLTSGYVKAVAPVLSQPADKHTGHFFVSPGYGSILHIEANNVDVIVYNTWLKGMIDRTPGRVVLLDRIWYDNDWPIIGTAGTPSHWDMPDPRSEAFANMRMDIRLSIGTTVVFNTFQWKDRCWNAENGQNNGDCNNRNNYVKIKEGLAGFPSVSYESATKPDHYWCHFASKLSVKENDGTDQFKEDCSFIPVAGLQNQLLLSMKPVNFPLNFVRHQNGDLRHDPVQEGNTYEEDATWMMNHRNLEDENKVKFLGE